MVCVKGQAGGHTAALNTRFVSDNTARPGTGTALWFPDDFVGMLQICTPHSQEIAVSTSSPFPSRGAQGQQVPLLTCALQGHWLLSTQHPEHGAAVCTAQNRATGSWLECRTDVLGARQCVTGAGHQAQRKTALPHKGVLCGMGSTCS